jgi:hypothetical protein
MGRVEIEIDRTPRQRITSGTGGTIKSISIGNTSNLVFGDFAGKRGEAEKRGEEVEERCKEVAHRGKNVEERREEVAQCGKKMWKSGASAPRRRRKKAGALAPAFYAISCSTARPG